jgi:hypothetical protein
VLARASAARNVTTSLGAGAWQGPPDVPGDRALVFKHDVLALAQILMACDPIAGDELGQQRLVEPARHFEVDLFDDGRENSLAAGGLLMVVRQFPPALHALSIVPRERGQLPRVAANLAPWHPG